MGTAGRACSQPPQPVTLEEPGRPGLCYDAAYAEQLSELSLRGGFLMARKAIRKGVHAPTAQGMLSLGRVTYGLTGLLSALDVQADWRSYLAISPPGAPT